MFDYHKNWMEFWFLIVVIAGVFIAFLVQSAVISYFIIFVSGIFAGRLFYERKGKLLLPYIIIITGFVIGFLIGANYGNRHIIIILFVIGAVLSYKLYDKKILKDTRF